MPHRFVSWLPPAPLLSLLAMLSLYSQARAHRLEAEYRMLPGHEVAVESWFDLTGDSPVGAEVIVYKADGEALVRGRLDGKGLFIFSYAQSEPLRIVVSAGAGHRKELQIAAAELSQDTTSPDTPAGQADLSVPLQATGRASMPLADRSSRVSVKDVLVGVGLLIAVAALGLALGNARKLRELERKLREKDAV